VSFGRYGSYRESGVDWLGLVPDHWVAHRLGFHFDERREKVSDADYAPLSVTKQGIVPQLETAAKTDDGDNRKKVLAGDFVINSRSDRKGSAGLSRLDGSVSLINTVLAPKSSIHGRFAHYLLRSVAFQEEFYRYGKGIVADLWSTNYSEMRNIALAVPPLGEQVAVATFLDRETAKIDALVEEQRRLIEVLKEKRQAVISHAVTRGLDHSAPMKDSGIEWLGEVPAHWEVVRLGRAIDYQEGPGIMADDFRDEGVPLMRVSGVGGRWATLQGCNYLDPEKVAKRWDHFRLTRGEMIISASASMGTVSEVGPDVVGAVPYTGLIRLRPKDQLTERDYIRSLVSSWLFFVQIDLLKTGATIQHFGPVHLAQMFVTRPPLAEQRAIAVHVEEQEEQFAALIGAAESGIELLIERRAALISAAVTGKIDVRDQSAASAELKLT